jgi:thiamine biosynthesis protein ThiS
MRITVNGEDMMMDDRCSVADLLARCELAEAPCAVEVNRALVPKREHRAHELQDGDVIEIVTLVGGG